MAATNYPVGIQTFSEMIRERCVYEDMADFVWRKAHYAKYLFLSWPCLFGKSLLSSKLADGRELFEGLKVMGLEEEWRQYPVLHFDLSEANHMSVQLVCEKLIKNNAELREMQAYLADIPYIEGSKKKLEQVSNAERFYEYTFYLIFSMFNAYARTQDKCANGRSDNVVWMPDAIYMMELKENGTSQETLQQTEKPWLCPSV